MEEVRSDLIGERLEPTASIVEPAARPSREESDSGSRRRPPQDPEKKAEPAEDSEKPPHQIDSLA